MRPASIFAKALRDERWQVMGFGVALAVMSSTSVFLWPSVRDTLQNFTLPTAVQAFLGTDLSIATAPGYLSARYFGWVDILLIVYAVIQGTGAIAGEESSGTMDLLLAQPIARRDVVLQKVAAVVIGSAAIIVIGWLGFAASLPFVGIHVSLGDSAVASANMLPITLLFFALALWAGAVAPSRGVAAGMTIGLATAAYFISTLANGVDSLRGLRYATPFYYYGSGESLVHGIQWWHVALLLGIAAALVALTVRTFERRDVSTGGSADVDMAGLLRRIVTGRA
jgi:ABC-2 type transport system permease protein